MLYRWTKRTPSDTTPPIKYGEVIRWDDARLSQATKDRMIASGTLAEVSTPPLSELPEWEERARALAKVGIITISDLVAGREKELSKATGKTPKVIRQWQSEVLEWLNPEPQPSNSAGATTLGNSYAPSASNRTQAN